MDANSSVATLQVPIQNDIVQESDGIIMVTILAPTNSGDYQIGSQSVGQVKVSDNDTQYRVSISTSSDTITEGESASFIFRSHLAAPANGLDINYRLTRSKIYISSEAEQIRNKYGAHDAINEDLTITIPAGETSVSIELESTDNNIDDADGVFYVYVKWGARYRMIDSQFTRPSKTIEIIDNDATPEITITGNTSVIEGTDSHLEFTASANRMYSNKFTFSFLTIKTLVTGPHEIFFSGTQLKHFRLDMYQLEATLRVAVPDNEIDDHNRQITAKILPSTYQNLPVYLVGTPNIAQVTIIDDEESRSQIPDISVRAVKPMVREGDDIVYEIKASHASNNDYFIHFRSNSEINIHDNKFTFDTKDGGSVIMPAGQTVYYYVQKTRNYESTRGSLSSLLDGKSQLLLRSGPGYRIATMPNDRATVTVRRFEEPSGISIIGGETVREYFERVIFQVTAPTTSQFARVVNVDVTSGTNSNLIVGTRQLTVTIPANELAARLDVIFNDNEINEQDQYITATLKDGPGYTVDSTKNSASVLVLDDDNELPVVTLHESLNHPQVGEHWIEGNERSFLLTATGVFWKGSREESDIDVNVKAIEVGGTNNFLSGSINKSVTIPFSLRTKGFSDAVFRILVPEDSEEEEDGQITVSILPGDGYEVSSTLGSKTLSIYDDDGNNEFSIVAYDTSVTEGEFARFLISTTKKRGQKNYIWFSYGGGIGDFISGTPNSSIFIPETRNSRILYIPTVDDEIDEPDGSVNVTLLGGWEGSETVSATARSASVIVLDNDESSTSSLPEITLSTINSSIEEGGTATITITSDQAAPADGLVIHYNRSQSGNFFASSFAGSDSVTLSAGETTKTIDLVTHDDNVDEPNGSFTITLATSTNYTPGSTSSITVNVADNDIPVISIADATAVVEGTDDNAVFTITSSLLPKGPLAINFVIDGDVGFLPTRQTLFHNVTNTSAQLTFVSNVATGNYTATLNVPIHDDEVDEADGSITVTLLADNNSPVSYNVSSVVANQSAEVTVTDNDEPAGLPVVSLSPTTSTIDEGDIGRIVFSSNRAAPASGLSVSYSISQIGNILDPFVAGTTEVLIPAGETSKEFGFRTNLDYIYQPNSSFTVSLNRSSTYSLGATSVATVSVNERFYPPRLTMTNAKAVYDSSGAFAEFYIRSDSRFVGTKTINVLVNGVTHTDQNRPIPSSVDMQGSGGTIPYTITNPGTILRVPIHQNQISERTGRIMATISAPTNTSDYRFGNAISRWIDITAFTAQSSSLPEISVSVVSRQVFGEEKKYFNVSTSSPSPNPININFTAFFDTNTLKYYNDHFHLQQGPKVFILPAGASEYEFDFEEFMLFGQTGAQFKEAGGKVEFTLLNGNDYLVASSPNNKATITRSRDYELSGISIIAEEAVFENWLYVEARFKLQATSAIQTDRIINVDVNERNSNFLLLTGQSQIVLPAGEVETIFNVAIENDEVDEPDGVITATILPGTGYTVASTQNSASVNVFDDDGTPNVYILSESDDPYYRDWIEGATRRIKFRSSGVPTGTVVKFRITDGGTNIYKGTEIRTVSWRTHTNYLDIDTNFDIVPEDDATITIEVIPGTGYEKASVNGEVSFTVYDDDQINRISVQALESTITEGQYAQFQLSASITKSNLYGVHFILDDGSGDFIGTIPTRGSTSTNYSYFEPYQLSESEGGIGFSANEITRLIRVPYRG